MKEFFSKLVENKQAFFFEKNKTVPAFSQKAGALLLELVLVMGIMAVVFPALYVGLFTARSGKAQQNQRIQAVVLMKQTQEAVKSVRNQGWNVIPVNGTYHPVVINNNKWALNSGTATVNGFTQSVLLSSVYRDATGAIVSSGGTLDPSTRKVDITIAWLTPLANAATNSFYITRYLGNATYNQTTSAEFNTDSLVNTQVTSTSGGEVTLGNNLKAKWCSPSFSTSTIDLPDGPPVAVAARSNATSTSIPNDVLVATSPLTTNDVKMSYVNVSANSDPPIVTPRGIFTLNPSLYASGFPTGIGIDNNFKTNGIKYYTSSTGKLYALIATNLPTKEVIAVLVNDNDDNSSSEYADPVNHIFKYWSYFDTKIFPAPTTIATATPTPNYTPTPTPTVAVINGNLETGTISPFNTVITSGTGTITTTPVHAGGFSAKVTTSQIVVSGVGGGGGCAGGKRIPVTANSSYALSGWVNAPTTGNNRFRDARIRVVTYSTCIGGTAINTTDSTLLSTTGATWTQLNGTATTGTGTYAEIQLLLRSSTAGLSTVYFDDITLNYLVPTLAPTSTPVPVPTTPASDQAPYGAGVSAITVLGSTGYAASGGYLYSFDLTNIDSKSPNNPLDQIGCRIQIDGYDCQPGPTGHLAKYWPGEVGNSYSDFNNSSHPDCSDGGNVELTADDDITAIQVGSNTYVFVAVGGGTTPELDIVDASTPPTGGTLYTNSCGISTAAWKRVSYLDFNPIGGSEEAANSVFVKSDATRVYISSNGGVDADNNGQPDSKQFYIIDTTDKANPRFLGNTAPSPTLAVPTKGYYYGGLITPTPSGTAFHNDLLFPRRSLTVLNGQRAVLVGKTGTTPTPTPRSGFPTPTPAPVNNAQEYQVLDLTNENAPIYCGGIDFNNGFNDLTYVTEADYDTFVYMVANTTVNELKIIQGGPDGTYVANGTVESAPFDAGYSTTFNRFFATATAPGTSTLTYQLAVANPADMSCVGAACCTTGVTYTYVGPDGTAGTTYSSTGGSIFLGINTTYTNPGRCFRWKASMSTTDYNSTPVINDVSTNYSP